MEKSTAVLLIDATMYAQVERTITKRPDGLGFAIDMRSSPTLHGAPTAPNDENCWEVLRFKGSGPEVKMASFLNDILLRVAIAARRDCLRRFFTKSLRKVVHPPTVALFPRSVRAQFAKWLFVKKPRLMSKSVATGILSRALLKRDGVTPPSVQDPFTTILSPIMILISWIFYLPIKHRKALLDACRIQAPIWQNKTLSASFSSLPPVYVLHFCDRSTSSFQITNTDLASYFEHVWMFPTLCSLLSYFVRAENTLHIQEFVKEKEISLEKELQAAIWYETQLMVV